MSKVKTGVLVFLIGWVVISLFLMEPFVNQKEPSVVVRAEGVELRPFKGTALMLQPQPPIIDPEVNGTITLPPVIIEPSPEIPPDINRTVLANENRNLALIIPDVIIDARYMSKYDWWLEIKLYAHEEGISTWSLFYTYNMTSSAPFKVWDYEDLNNNRWVATLVNPLELQIILQYVLWKTHSDAYPLWLAIDIRVRGAIQLSCDDQGCDYMTSDPYQQSVRVVAP